jgi:hypothetical protein
VIKEVNARKDLEKLHIQTIEALRAKNEQQAKEVNSWILKKKITFYKFQFYIIKIDQMIKAGNALKELEKLHIQTIAELSAKIDNMEKEVIYSARFLNNN